MKKTITATVAIASASLLVGATLAAPASAAPTEPPSISFELSTLFGLQEQPSLEKITKNLSSAEVELMESGAPAIIHQEVETGEILKVEKLD